MKQKRAISYETHRRAALRSPLLVQYGRLFQSARTCRRDTDAYGNRHGDRYGVKSSLSRLSYRAEELSCGCALFGHTHRAFSGYVGRALLINPGALMDGRYAVLNVEDGRVVPKLLRL